MARQEPPFSENIHRRTLLPALALTMSVRSYLEIGVKGGKTFFGIPAARKVAVDPRFKFGRWDRWKHEIQNRSFGATRYFETPSDNFFDKHAPDLWGKGDLDLVFVDGLHTAEQSMRDVTNALAYVDRGVIVLHDTCPPHKAAAQPAATIFEARRMKLPGWDGHWCGDVWKTGVYLRKFRPDLQMFTIDEDSGISIICRNPHVQKVDDNPSSIESLTFEDLQEDKVALLGVRKFDSVAAAVEATIEMTSVPVGEQR